MSTMIKMAKLNSLQQISQTYQRSSRVQIVDFLESESAQHIYDALKSQTQWNLAWNLDGQHQDMDYTAVQNWTQKQREQLDELIYAQASDSFQYRYASVPIYDIYQQNLLPGHFFNSIYEFFNSDELLTLARQVTGFEQIDFADVQATRYSKGHFLTEHDDNVAGKNRLAAFVLNLTPKWKFDWGGGLVFPDKNDQAETWFPKFNALNIFTVPQKHAVTVVSPFATEERYALTGWFRSHQS
ncbi:2OG-Fe(II) oxygenase [Arenicella xantha]|uniref:Rps23 Pro-64 3,4-dihydroxylase Tpa1-like proline 4-hydroxylase n=1 Tax=Arenicella xantha TaxID=644221 RepID=A0A395JJZ4_9GAMM|nr:2OG-Fe(II) oxygenase family protein [Arenicella xantha]RBP51103.1 Rps23 Pro-64 3,4-dihydroxylase Tpa1-like proline 4-hydroxylase [Arenicella xantha]